MVTLTDPAPALALHVGGLPADDVRRVTAFLRISSDRLQHRWQLISEGSADVLLTGLDDPPTLPGSLDDPTVRLRAVPAESMVDGDDTLLRSPIQFDDLVRALADAERVVAGRRGMPAMRHKAGAGDAPVHVPAAGASVPAAPRPQPLLQPRLEQLEPPATSPEAPAVRLIDQPGQRFRLKRWPGAPLLQGTRYGIRLASFISSRALSIDDLARLSNVERAECERFLAALAEAAMLRHSAPESPSPPAASHPTSDPASAAPVAAPASPPAPLSMLARLRQRLGLSR